MSDSCCWVAKSYMLATIFLGSKITVISDCSHRIKRCCFLLGRIAVTNLDSVFESRAITLPTKVCISYGFSSCSVEESWTIKKAEHWRIDAFELWCWRRLLRVPWTARVSNQSILKKINPEYSLEVLMVKLKLQYFGYLMWRFDSGKDLNARKDWGQEEKGATEDEMVEWYHWLKGHEFEQTQRDSDGQRSLTYFSPWGPKESDTTWWVNNNNVSYFIYNCIYVIFNFKLSRKYSKLFLK